MHETNKKLSKTEQNKILRVVQSGNLSVIQNFKAIYPNKHWSELRYEKTGDTILHIAARLGYISITNYILTNYSPPVVDCKNNDSKTPLHEAAQFAQYETTKYLLEHGADVNALKRADWTPLMLACTKIHEKTSFGTVELLIKNGALINFSNKDGWTALHLISREGDKDILNLLVKHNIDIFKKSNNGRTALHIASLHGNIDVVKILVKRGICVNVSDNCGNTPLHEAILGGHTEICDYLLHRDANILAKNKCGFGLVHLAASVNHVPIIKYLVTELKMDCNSVSDVNYTPLHCAARKNLTEAVTCLTYLGADINIRDKYGRLPSDYLKT